ncbi:MAG: hypothetical protein DCO96_06170 [Fluviicola sp. XM-24bin1]|nr:MAG: hypothetical protein DCO96_06170 [Fluviicola sp. XM-24bin1]
MPSQAQDYAVDWGEMQRSNGRMIQILPDSMGNFYALRWVGGNLMGSYKVSRHDNLEQVARGSISLQVPGGIGTFEGLRLVGDRPIAFLSDKRGDTRLLFMQEYTKEVERTNEPIELASYAVDKLIDRGWFDVIQSNNGKYFAVIWEIPGKKEERDRYGFRIYDTDMNEINEGDYRLPFTSELSTIHGHYLSNDGDYFLSISEYEKGERNSIFRDNREFVALHIYHIAQDGLQDYKLDVDDRRIIAMTLSTATTDSLTVTGIYGMKDTPGVDGVFYQRIDLRKGEATMEGFKKFDQDFITQDWSERDINRLERREERGVAAMPQLYNYRMREAHILDDGSIVGTLEQYYIQVNTNNTGQTGDFSNNYHYYYNDIIAYKIDGEGQFDWVSKINKIQVSTNDGGPYSSYESFVADGKLNFIFNDHINNYDESGDFIDNRLIYAANYSRRRNVVALASVDLSSGVIGRKPFFDREDIGALVMPKLFNVNYRSNEVLIYAIWGRKEKFGLLRF